MVFLSLATFSTLKAQNGSLQGIVIDNKTKETIVGANVLIKGTTKGASTDFDGKFEINNLKPGVYTLVISYISYNSSTLENIKVEANNISNLTIEIQEQSTNLSEIEIVAERKTDTEISMISIIKSSDLVSSGVSSQQISKTQDRDASEVVKRIPGVTVIDNRFIVVRGLNERYNAVWLNNASTPSSESDVKAFSFDVIPSSMIDRVLVYKTPAPELPSDFAGGAIQVFTKNNLGKNYLSASFSGSYRAGTTGQQFLRTEGSKTDWLGFDNGLRALPSNFPSYSEMITLSNSSLQSDKDKIVALGRDMNKIWTANEMKAKPDLRFTVSGGTIFKLKKISISNISSLTYSNTFSSLDIYRADYENYDTINDKSDTSYRFNDQQFSNTVKVSALFNWSFKLSNKNKIEFRNLFNQIGVNKTTIRDGIDNYGGNTIKAFEYRYQSRSVYSGQLSGDHELFKASNLNWLIGYSFANKKEPDVKRLTMLKTEEDPNDPHYGQYAVQIPFAATPELTGRLHVEMNENIYNSGANLEQKLKIGSYKFEMKVGFYTEFKNREFNTRNIGYRIAKTSSYNWDIPYLSIDDIFLDSNINSTTGIRIDEKTNASDSYIASNELLAAYISFKLPIKSVFNIYTGVRLEKNKQTLNSFQIDDPTIEVKVNNDTLNIFPSIALTYDLSDRSLLRLTYGMTVNRPEFREIAPMLFYDFELKAGVRGNPDLKNSYINNFDFRYEFYPSPAESFMIGAFYKKFKNPIESTVIPAGSGLDYTFTNAESATNYGIEVELKKSFISFENKSNFLRYFKNFSLVANAALIKSEVQFNDKRLEKNRSLQGQSPYIVNAGIFYQKEKIGLTVNLLYNIIGKRIVTVGNPYQNTPDVYEMQRHLADLTISKKIGEHILIKASVQDIFNNKVIFRQIINFNKDINGDGIGDGDVQRVQDMKSYAPGTYFSLGFSANF